MIMEKLSVEDKIDAAKDFAIDQSYVSSIVRYVGMDLKERSQLNKKIKFEYDFGGK
ncbi:MAG: hypothetical protein Q7J54_07720 [Candidatus Woesearchaeota archaeon]|nr:hypothetical protein [Candidatus Woesearchaeota archaeon]